MCRSSLVGLLPREPRTSSIRCRCFSDGDGESPVLSQRLQTRVRLEQKDDARLSFAADTGTIELATLSKGQIAAILALQGAGATEQSLCDIIAETDGAQ